MLARENFTEKHIRELQSNSKKDPILIERTVYAFGLLEAIARAGMPFIFKGGTCLMLLLEHPQRLSTDIDIIVEPGTDVEEYIEKAAKVFPFVRYDEQRRIGKNHIEKRHFKFIYVSYGDSSVLCVMFELAICVSISKKSVIRCAQRELRAV